MPETLRAYLCCVPKWCTQAYGGKCGGCASFFTASDMRQEEVVAHTRGQARYRYLVGLWDVMDKSDVSFADIRVESLGPVGPRVTDGMLRIRRCYPDVPPLHCGMPLRVCGNRAVLVDADAAYLHIIMTDGPREGQRHVCHPVEADYDPDHTRKGDET